MASSTVENYIKQIYLEQQKGPHKLVPMGQLAEAMNVVPGTATTMIKALADSGLVVYEPRNGTKLTKGGERLALHVLRRHRLLELFLVKILGLDWSEVHSEAEELEHAISDKVLDKIDTFLGHPRVDPHGDPIPSAQGKLEQTSLISLAECAPNKLLRIARIVDQHAQFLQFAERSGLLPGTSVIVKSRDPIADSITVECSNRTVVTLGTIAAKKILVEQ